MRFVSTALVMMAIALMLLALTLLPTTSGQWCWPAGGLPWLVATAQAGHRLLRSPSKRRQREAAFLTSAAGQPSCIAG